MTKGALKRALYILHTLAVAARNRGVGLKLSDNDQTCMDVDGQLVPFGLKERVRQRPHRLTADERQEKRRGYYYGPVYDYEGTGQLSLEIHVYAPGGYKKAWSDKLALPLEYQLNGFMVSIYHASADLKQKRLEREAERKASEHRQEMARQVSIQREREQKHLDVLLETTRRWREVMDLRAFLAAVEASLLIDGRTLEVHEQAWLYWAHLQADQRDPLLAGDAPWQPEVDKKSPESDPWSGLWGSLR